MSDLISRESVRAGRIPYDEDLTEYQRGWNDACDAIADNAPEAQRDHNASYSRSHENDPISRQTVMDFVGSMEMCDEISAEAYQKLMNYLEELPSAQPERKRGEWNRYYRMHSGDTFVCNRCGSCFVVLQGEDKMNLCPNCGADMRGEQG